MKSNLEGEMMNRTLSIFVIASMVMSGLVVGPLLFSTPVTAPGPDLPDLTIWPQNITISPAVPIAGESVTINATVWNIGTADAANVDINFYGEGTLIGSENIDIPVITKWKNLTLDSEGMVGRYSSIAADGENGLHISYFDNTNYDLKYVYKPSGGSWAIRTVDSEGMVGEYPSIAIDGINGIHISYRDNTNNALKYAYKPNGGSWTTHTVESGCFVGEFTSIAVDKANGVHLSYHDETNFVLKYAYKPSGGSWTTYIVDSSNTTGAHSSVAVDSDNGVHISYLDAGNQDLKYAYKPNGGNWTTYTIDSMGQVGHYSSIAIDNENSIHISYYDDTNQDLKYAYKPNGGSWTNYTIDSQGSIGVETSIAIDSMNGVHISYPDDENDDLKYAYKPSGGIWSTYIVDSQGNIGKGSSITVDTEEGIHISYYDNANQNLKYASWIAPLGNIQTSISWTPPIPGQYNIIVKIDENNEIQEINETNNEATIEIIVDSSDEDLDGMPCWWEKIYSLDPLDPSDSALDPDLDSLTNLQEYLNNTNPHNNETDGDSLGDGFEVIFSKTKPNNWDTNGNGIGDGLEFLSNQGYAGSMQSLPDDWIGMTITWANYTILVKTNSSVLEGEFDKEEQKLKIKVSGPNGTQGVTEIDIPKSLCEPKDIEIELDGELINYTLNEDETYYYIHIEYNHSIHELTANFLHISKPPTEPTDKEEGILAYIYLISLIIALIIIVLMSMVIIRTRGKSEDIGIQELPPEKLSILLDKKHAEGKITDETYNDAKSLLEKYRGD
jgi:hypothetical protein